MKELLIHIGEAEVDCSYFMDETGIRLTHVYLNGTHVYAPDVLTPETIRAIEQEIAEWEETESEYAETDAAHMGAI